MNIEKLTEAEAAFLSRYPRGFADPGLAHVRKSHNVERLADYTRANVTDQTLSRPNAFADVLLTIVARSSLVSRFEKPPFKAFIESLGLDRRRRLADAFRKRLFGRRRREGFEEVVEILARGKLGRWSLVSAVPFYFAPRKEVFVKPSTAKRIVAFLELEKLRYDSSPTWAFYRAYRDLVLEINAQVDPSLTPNNAATTGFLMATM